MRTNLKRILYGILDVLFLPLTIPIAFILKKLRTNYFDDFPLTKKVFFWIGVYPISDHYYEPLFNTKHLKKSLRIDRNLPGIDFNDDEQLQILDKFNYNKELEEIPQFPEQKSEKIEYCYADGPFLSGDAEFLYNMIRYFKPKRLIEIGSGHSTLLALKAIKASQSEDHKYSCQHICVEPFENSWLKELDIELIREKVEDLETSFFSQLEQNDILFIDSSHMIRPQGDVLFEYLELLPVLNSGVIIHIHDIFTPKDYLDEWIEIARFWNEQYLLEAFLTNNLNFRIIGATNFLMHKYYEEFSAKCPILKLQRENGDEREPASFWIVKN